LAGDEDVGIWGGGRFLEGNEDGSRKGIVGNGEEFLDEDEEELWEGIDGELLREDEAL